MDSIETIAVVGLSASAACAIGALYVGGTLHRWAAWSRVRRENRRRQRERKLMMRYQQIGNGARRRK